MFVESVRGVIGIDSNLFCVLDDCRSWSWYTRWSGSAMGRRFRNLYADFVEKNALVGIFILWFRFIWYEYFKLNSFFYLSFIQYFDSKIFIHCIDFFLNPQFSQHFIYNLYEVILFWSECILIVLLLCSSYGGDQCWRCWWSFAPTRCYFIGVVQELEIRTRVG